MKHLMLLTCAMCALVSGVRAETTVGTADQKSLDMVIYNNDRALVRDTRAVSMGAGQNDIAFADISDQIIPASVVLNGRDITFLENNFNFDVLSYESLLHKSVGNTVTAQLMNPKTGAWEITPAELLAVNGMSPILKINDKVDASYPGQIVFNTIPKNLRVRPTLVMSVATPKAGKRDLTLGYLTRGLSWNANYVAQLAPDNQTMSLTGWVSLTNASQTAFRNVKLQVVAGDLHLVEPVMPMMYKTARMEMGNFADTMMAAGMSEEGVGDYHLYTLPRKTDILPNQTKQVSLLSATGVKVKKTYTFENQLTPPEQAENVKPTISLSFVNEKKNHLGIALPRGIVRLYQADKQGEFVFVGEDNIGHTGNLEQVRLNMGQAFDISATVKRIKHDQCKQGNTRITDDTYHITIKNGTKETVSVQIKETFGVPGVSAWKITSETKQSERKKNVSARWTLSVPAEGKADLTYSVQIVK